MLLCNISMYVLLFGRYSVICPSTFAKLASDPRACAQKSLIEAGLNPDNFRCGTTKVNMENHTERLTPVAQLLIKPHKDFIYFIYLWTIDWFGWSLMNQYVWRGNLPLILLVSTILNDLICNILHLQGWWLLLKYNSSLYFVLHLSRIVFFQINWNSWAN